VHLDLVGGDGGIEKAPRLVETGGREVRDADPADRPRVTEFVEGAQGLRRIVRPQRPVDVQEVDARDVESVEALVGGPVDVVVGAVVIVDLRREEDRLPVDVGTAEPLPDGRSLS